MRYIILIAIFACFAQTLSAAELQLFPLRLTLTPNVPISAFRLSNVGAEAARLQLSVRKWTQGESGDDYQPTSDVIGNPPLFSVESKGVQTVRIGIAQAHTDDIEQSYRAFFQEIPSALHKNAAVQTLLQISVPIFIPPAHPLPPELTFTPAMQGNFRTLEIKNTGNQHVQILKLTLTGPGGKVISTTPMSFYILAGCIQTWKAKSPDGKSQGAWPDTLHIEAETDQGPLTADISGHNAGMAASR